VTIVDGAIDDEESMITFNAEEWAMSSFYEQIWNHILDHGRTLTGSTLKKLKQLYPY